MKRKGFKEFRRFGLSAGVFLFLSTIALTGPAWCSHLCYFGGLDNAVAGKRSAKKNWRHLWRYRSFSFLIILLGTLILK